MHQTWSARTSAIETASIRINNIRFCFSFKGIKNSFKLIYLFNCSQVLCLVLDIERTIHMQVSYCKNISECLLILCFNLLAFLAKIQQTAKRSGLWLFFTKRYNQFSMKEHFFFNLVTVCNICIWKRSFKHILKLW